MPKRGAKKGNTNALQGEVRADCAISVRCTPQQKETWEKAAAEEGLNLSPWIKEVLDYQTS